jgi:hypothetical protein
VVAVIGAGAASVIMAEYEFEGFTPWLAAIAVGILVGEVVAGVGRWRGTAAMVVCAVIATGSLLWGEWLESDSGVEKWAAVAWAAAALAAGVAAWGARDKPATAPRPPAA